MSKSIVTDFPKVWKKKEYQTDFISFRLHAKVTLPIFMFCSFLITGPQMLSHPMKCWFPDVEKEFADSFCWTNSTYIIPYKQGRRFIYPGVMIPFDPVKNRNYGQEEFLYQTAYQFYGLLLLMQAGSFYLPRLLWKYMEMDVIAGMVKPLKARQNEKPSVELKNIKEGVAMRIYSRSNYLQAFCYKYMGCEFLAWANVLAQFFVINWYMKGGFITYGLEAVGILNNNPFTMDYNFPKLTKCNLEIVGPSGSYEFKDGLCSLPLNKLNERIYIALWFWLVGVAIVGCVSLMTITCLLTCTKARSATTIDGKYHLIWYFLELNLLPDVVDDLRKLVAEEMTRARSKEV